MATRRRRERQTARSGGASGIQYVLLVAGIGVIALFLLYNPGFSTGEARARNYYTQNNPRYMQHVQPTTQLTQQKKPYTAYPAQVGVSAIPGAPECSDRVDNDGDGSMDWPNDAGCTTRRDTSEKEARMPCDDGVDNDGNGLIDYPRDAGCKSPEDMYEYGGVQQSLRGCQDSDGGFKPDVAGIVSIGDGQSTLTYKDRCISNANLFEYTCESGQTAYKQYTCPSQICRNGACQSYYSYEGYKSTRRITNS